MCIEGGVVYIEVCWLGGIPGVSYEEGTSLVHLCMNGVSYTLSHNCTLHYTTLHNTTLHMSEISYFIIIDRGNLKHYNKQVIWQKGIHVPYTQQVLYYFAIQ